MKITQNSQGYWYAFASANNPTHDLAGFYLQTDGSWNWYMKSKGFSTKESLETTLQSAQPIPKWICTLPNCKCYA